jgi:hypothetical protein
LGRRRPARAGPTASALLPSDGLRREARKGRDPGAEAAARGCSIGLIGAAAAGVLTLLVACSSRLLADEFKAWVPSLVDRIIFFAVSRAHLRERLAEEWCSHVNDTPGDLGKLVAAFGFVWASRKLRNEAEHGGIEGDHSMRELDDQQLFEELMRRGEELQKNPPERLTDLGAWPSHCGAARDVGTTCRGCALFFTKIRENLSGTMNGSTPEKHRTDAVVSPLD